MTDTVDLFDPSFPHGTANGFDMGCKGSACPCAHDPEWLSCREAQWARNGNYKARGTYGPAARIPRDWETRQPGRTPATPKPAAPTIKPADTIRPVPPLDDVADKPTGSSQDTTPVEAGDVVETPESAWITRAELDDLIHVGTKRRQQLIKDGTIRTRGQTSTTRYHRADALAWLATQTSAGENVSSPATPAIAPTVAETSPAEPDSTAQALLDLRFHRIAELEQALQGARATLADRDAALSAARARITELEALVELLRIRQRLLLTDAQHPDIHPVLEAPTGELVRTGGESTTAPRRIGIAVPDLDDATQLAIALAASQAGLISTDFAITVVR